MPIQDNDTRSNNIIVEKRLQDINEYIKTLQNEQTLKEYLSCSVQYGYSTNNNVLIRQQMPNATRVMGKGAWEKLGRKIEDEQGITILAPRMEEREIEREKVDPKTKQPILDEDGFPYTEKVLKKELVGFDQIKVYDISQTSGSPISEKDDFNLDTLYAALCQNSSNENKEQAVKSELKAITANNLSRKETDDFKLQCAYYAVCAHYRLDTSDIALPIADLKMDFSNSDKIKKILDAVAKCSAKVINAVNEKSADISFDTTSKDSKDERSSHITAEKSSEEWNAESKHVYNEVKAVVEKPGVFFTEETKVKESTKPVTEKEQSQMSADISEIRGKPDKSIADYLAIHKSLVHKQQSTMTFYKGFAERKLDKFGNLIGKQEKINQKIQRRENKMKKYENKVARLSDTSQMLSSFFEGKKTPALLAFAIQHNDKRIEKLRDQKIPRNESKLQRLQGKSAKNLIKLESTIAKVDKLQALSSVVKSFNILNPTKRREQFTAAMDELHNASERAVMCKIEKCSAKITRLENALPEKQLDYSISDIEVEEKIERLEAKKGVLSQKLDKLKGLQKPFSELDEGKSNKLVDDVKVKVDGEVKNVERAKQCSDFAEDIAVYATEKANALAKEKNIAADQRKPSLDERINKARADNPQRPSPNQEKQQEKKQEPSL